MPKLDGKRSSLGSGDLLNLDSSLNEEAHGEDCRILYEVSSSVEEFEVFRPNFV